MSVSAVQSFIFGLKFSCTISVSSTCSVTLCVSGVKLDKKLVELTSHINTMKGKGPLKGKTKRLEQSLTHTLKRLSDLET